MTELGRSGRDRWLLYQSSIGSPVYDIFAARPEPKLVNYHNITPANLLRDWEPNVAYEVALGRTQLARLAPQSRLAVADSAFNESELHALGYEDTAVVPLLIDMQRKSEEADPAVAARLAGTQGGTRAAPISSSWARSHRTRPRTIWSRCWPSCGASTIRRRACTWSARRWGRPTSPRCAPSSPSSASTTPSTSPDRSRRPSSRRTCRRPTCSCAPRTMKASACPLTEAMGHGIPIVAYGVTAVPETVGDAGLLLPDKSPLRFAAAVGRVLSDDTLRRHLTAAGLARAAGFNLPDSQRRFVSLVQRAVGAPAGSS